MSNGWHLCSTEINCRFCWADWVIHIMWPGPGQYELPSVHFTKRITKKSFIAAATFWHLICTHARDAARHKPVSLKNSQYSTYNFVPIIVTTSIAFISKFNWSTFKEWFMAERTGIVPKLFASLMLFICFNWILAMCLTQYWNSRHRSVHHTFFTMLLPSYHHEIFRINYHRQTWCPCNMPRSEVKGQVHRGQNKFGPFWALPEHNSSLNSAMALKWSLM